jgi:hypothetical protein
LKIFIAHSRLGEARWTTQTEGDLLKREEESEAEII